MASIGFIGLGAMGLPMAGRLLEAGHGVTVAVHRNPAPAGEIQRLGGRIAANVAEVAAAAEVLVSIVPGDAELEALYLSPATAVSVPPGTLVIEMTTASPAVMRRIGGHLQARGADVLDAPVSGGVKGAREGTLTIMCGGEARVHEAALPILRCMGARFPLVGGMGAGKGLKAVNQLLVGVNTVAVAEALALAREMDVDLEMMREVITTSSGNSAAFGNKFASMVRDDFSPRFTTPLMRKDLRIALDAGSGIALPLATMADHIYAMLGPEADTLDYSAIATLYRSGR